VDESFHCDHWIRAGKAKLKRVAQMVKKKKKNCLRKDGCPVVR
jgi:hypothetical protein